MAEMYRIPKNVHEEASQLDSLIAEEVRNNSSLSFESVIKVRDSWGLQSGTDWATSICSKIEDRAIALITIDEKEEESTPDLAE